MLPTKLNCPSCRATIQLGKALSAGQKIRCPKCSASFTVRPRANPHLAAGPRKASPPPVEDEDMDVEEIVEEEPAEEEPQDEEPRKRPARRKSRKRKEAPGKGLLIAGLLLGGFAILGTGTGSAILLWPSGQKTTVAQNAAGQGGANALPRGAAAFQNNPPPAAPPQAQEPPAQSAAPPSPQTPPPPPAGGPPPGGPPPRGGAQPPPAFRPPPPPPAAPPGGSTDVAAGQRVFNASCARCHTIGGGRRKGPDLGHVGADPNHTAEWLANYIRDPKSIDPDSSMPAFRGKINEPDLQALAEYLATLK